jgi:hypothetical protein
MTQEEEVDRRRGKLLSGLSCSSCFARVQPLCSFDINIPNTKLLDVLIAYSFYVNQPHT